MAKIETIGVRTSGMAEVQFTYDLPETIEEAVEMFQPETVLEMFKRAFIIAAQANARKLMSAGLNAERIQETMAQWKPGVTVSTRSSVKALDPVKYLSESFDDFTPERQEEIMRLIQERFNRRTSAPTSNGTEGTSEGSTEPVTAGDETGEGGEYNPAEARRRNR